jgi:hypothetical protein
MVREKRRKPADPVHQQEKRDDEIVMASYLYTSMHHDLGLGLDPVLSCPVLPCPTSSASDPPHLFKPDTIRTGKIKDIVLSSLSISPSLPLAARMRLAVARKKEKRKKNRGGWKVPQTRMKRIRHQLATKRLGFLGSRCDGWKPVLSRHKEPRRTRGGGELVTRLHVLVGSR